MNAAGPLLLQADRSIRSDNQQFPVATEIKGSPMTKEVQFLFWFVSVPLMLTIQRIDLLLIQLQLIYYQYLPLGCFGLFNAIFGPQSQLHQSLVLFICNWFSYEFPGSINMGPLLLLSSLASIRIMELHNNALFLLPHFAINFVEILKTSLLLFSTLIFLLGIPISALIILLYLANSFNYSLPNFIDATCQFVTEIPYKVAFYWTTVLVTFFALNSYLFKRIENFNYKRKIFHLLALVLFIPSILKEPAFSALCMELCLYIFLCVEYCRLKFSLLDGYLRQFKKKRENNAQFLLCHFDLLVGCALPLWINALKVRDMESGLMLETGASDALNFRQIFGKKVSTLFGNASRERGGSLLACSGVITIGIGDSVACFIGKRYGTYRFKHNKKSIEGIISFTAFTFLAFCILFGTKIQSFAKLLLICCLTAISEGLCIEDDNLVVSIIFYALYAQLH